MNEKLTPTETLNVYSLVKLAVEDEHSFIVADSNPLYATITSNMEEVSDTFVVKSRIGYYELFRKELAISQGG